MLARAVKWLLIYALLVGGSILFSIPFAWMAATSFKVDRELFTRDLRFVPLTPVPAAQSPYVDEAYFQYVDGPHKAELLPQLERLARAGGFTPPADVPDAPAFRQLAVGLYERLSRTLPQSTW